jgi:hypothetical protein
MFTMIVFCLGVALFDATNDDDDDLYTSLSTAMDDSDSDVDDDNDDNDRLSKIVERSNENDAKQVQKLIGVERKVLSNRAAGKRDENRIANYYYSFTQFDFQRITSFVVFISNNEQIFESVVFSSEFNIGKQNHKMNGVDLISICVFFCRNHC